MFDSTQLAGQRGFADETIELAKQALSGSLGKATGIDTTLGLVGYPLEAPSKKLYPVLSPIRNILSRVPVTRLGTGGMAGTALNWKQISAINSANLWASVAEGSRNSAITYTETPKSATFKSFGLDDSVTDESTWAGRGFEDVRAFSALAVLQAVMIQEERLILGGNITAIAAPATPTATATQLPTASGSLTASTSYSVKVSALTMQGYFQGATGRAGSTNSAGESLPSAVLTASTASSSSAGDTSLSFDWAASRGAFAYNVYAYTTTTVRYVATVFTNHYDLKALGVSTNVVNTADTTANALDYDGLIPQIEAASVGYFKDMAYAGFTADGAQGIVEIDAGLKSLWDNSRVGIDELWINSQEAVNFTKKLTNAGSSSVIRFTQDASATGIDAGKMVERYFNKFTGQWIPIKIHPYLPPGKVLGLNHHLPEWFPNNNIGESIAVVTLQEYADYEFARTTRSFPHGVYASEALVMYAPSFSAVWTCAKDA